MWELLTEIFKSHGVLALVLSLETAGLVYLYRQGQKKQEQLVALYRERVKDVTESKERYEELAHKLDDSIDLLIKVFKRTI
jgi:DNA-binding transcriptional ArsR family regulator